MEAQCFVDRSHQSRRNPAYCRADPFNGDRANLLTLGFEVHPQSRLVRWQEHLKRKDSLHVAGDGHDGHYAATKSLSHGVGLVIADQYRGATLVGLATAHRVQIDEVNLTAQHR